MNDVPVLPLEPRLAESLRGVSTATLSTVLLKKGLRNVWMRGTRAQAGFLQSIRSCPSDTHSEEPS